MVLTGPTLNGARVWEIEIEGTGGHGAAFYKTVDPLQAAARLAVEIPSIIGRYIDPSESALISVGKLQAIGCASLHQRGRTGTGCRACLCCNNGR